MTNFILQSIPLKASVAAQANEGLIGQALAITGVGMLILFASLFILWGVMELLVRYIKDPKEAEEEAGEAVEAETADADVELRRKAAAAAAAYAIAKK